MTPARDLFHSPLPLRGVGWRGLWALGAVAVHVALLRLYYSPRPKALLGDEGMYLRAAASVLETGRSQLGSFWPPLYAWFLAPLVGATGGALWLVQLVQTALLVLSAWLLRELILMALEDRWAADLGALLVVSYPPLVAYAHYLWPEVLHLTSMLAALWVLLRFGPRPAAAAGGGALLAVSLQSKVLLVPLLPLLALGLWRAWPRERRAASLLLLLAATALGVAPTLRAQHRDFGRWMLADSGAFNAWVGLNEASRDEFTESLVVEEYPRYQQSARSAAARERIAREKVGTLVRERGWLALARRQLGRQYHRLLDHESFLTRQLAGGEVWREGGGYRGAASLLSSTLRGVSFGSWALLLAATAWGVAFFPYRQRRAGRWALAFLLVQGALFLVLHVKTRYRIQMLPAMFLFAASAACWWRARPSAAWRSPVRLASALGLAGLLLYLAFAP